MDGIAYAAIIFVCAAVGGGTPLVMRHRLRGPRIDRAIRLGTIFGGGVFLGSGFLHLLADAAGELNDVDGYPYAELYCCCGVLFPLCVDSVASIFASRAKRLTRTARRGRLLCRWRGLRGSEAPLARRRPWPCGMAFPH